MWSQYLSQRDINQLIYGHYGDHRHCEWACVEQSESRIWGISLSGPFAMTTERVQRSEQHRLIQWIIWKTDWAREWVEVGERERERDLYSAEVRAREVPLRWKKRGGVIRREKASLPASIFVICWLWTKMCLFVFCESLPTTNKHISGYGWALMW